MTIRALLFASNCNQIQLVCNSLDWKISQFCFVWMPRVWNSEALLPELSPCLRDNESTATVPGVLPLPQVNSLRWPQWSGLRRAIFCTASSHRMKRSIWDPRSILSPWFKSLRVGLEGCCGSALTSLPIHREISKTQSPTSRISWEFGKGVVLEKVRLINQKGLKCGWKGKIKIETKISL